MIKKKEDKVRGKNGEKNVLLRLTAQDPNQKNNPRRTETRWYIKHIKSPSIFEVNKEDRISIKSRIYVSLNN